MRSTTARRVVHKMLVADGWEYECQSGSHLKYRRGRQTISVAAHGNRVGAPLDRIRKDIERLQREREGADNGR